MLSIEEAQLKQKDMLQAIDLEKQHRYIDLQGRKQRFSEFLSETLMTLAPFFTGSPPLEALKTALQQYPHMDLTQRMRVLESVSAILPSLVLSGQRTRTVMTRHGDTPPAEVPIQFVKGVGPRVAAVLQKAEIQNAEDLIYYFPRKYLDYQQRRSISQLAVGEDATIIGRVHGFNAHPTKNKALWVTTLTIQDDSGTLLATWLFAKANRPMIESFKARYTKGTEVMVSGKIKWDHFKQKPAIERPTVEILSYADDMPEDPVSASLHAGRIVPIYPLVQGLNLRTLRRAIRNALNDFLPAIGDPLPPEIRKRYQLTDIQTALEQVHFPETFGHYENARKRLVFDELFSLQARLAMIRNQYKRHVTGTSFVVQPHGLVRRFLETLPFSLTGAQERVFREIQSDMASHEPMYRLLQGDVGSGKTVIALLTLLVAVENGYQGALMAPTEILAEQHYRQCIQQLTPLGLKVALVLGRAGTRERRELLQGLLNGQIHIAVGTHALIQEAVAFQRLGAVVVDEQHRFGVRQRVRLKNKGDHPEMLTMTATPIPRTLAMTLHGDLDVSILDELPPGRSPIRTGLFQGRMQREQAYQLIRSELDKGQQAYIVFPLIEESENFSAKAATAEFDRLSQEIFPRYRLGLLHGKLPASEKDAVMTAFLNHHLDILVATTVIEVGVDVPNATVMLIENADRFGLAQLHQLRGRVGRGQRQSYCLLSTESRTPETMARLKILEDCTNGFIIAEKDLEIRGPGEFLGTRQSGLPDLVLADLIQDREILAMAREAAFELVDTPEGLSGYPDLMEAIFSKTQETFQMVNAG